MRKSSNSFDFEKLCFICCKEANIHKNKDNKKRVWIVRDTDFGERLNDICLAINNTFTKDIMKRLTFVDLTAVEGRYHEKCKLDIYAKRDAGSSKGRPEDETISDRMKIIFDYIDSSDDCQFSLKELHNLIGNFMKHYL